MKSTDIWTFDLDGLGERQDNILLSLILRLNVRSLVRNGLSVLYPMKHSNTERSQSDGAASSGVDVIVNLVTFDNSPPTDYQFQQYGHTPNPLTEMPPTAMVRHTEGICP